MHFALFASQLSLIPAELIERLFCSMFDSNGNEFSWRRKYAFSWFCMPKMLVPPYVYHVLSNGR